MSEQYDLAQLDDNNEWGEQWFNALFTQNASHKAEVELILRKQKKELGWNIVDGE